MKILHIAINTFKEAVRNKIYYLLIFFGIIFVLLSSLIGLLTIGDKTKIIYDVGLAAINFFCLLIAIFNGISLVYKEIDKKTIYFILSKPISRFYYLIGKFFGLMLTLLLAMLAMIVIFVIYLYVTVGSINPGIFLVFGMLLLELLIISAISLLFSSFSTPILSSIFTISFYLIGQITWTFNLFKEKLTHAIGKGVAYFFYYVLPNLHKFNLKNELVSGTKIEPVLMFHALLYAIFYISAMLLIATLIFKKKEFK